jgi:hypothetical protein
MTEQKVQFQCEIVRLVSDAFPGFVEARFRDGIGHEWVIVDKQPVFSAERFDDQAGYPQVGWIQGVVADRRVLPDGKVLARIKAMWVETEDGTNSYEIEESRLQPFVR